MGHGSMGGRAWQGQGMAEQGRALWTAGGKGGTASPERAATRRVEGKDVSCARVSGQTHEILVTEGSDENFGRASTMHTKF